MAGLRLTKAEREWIRLALFAYAPEDVPEKQYVKITESIREKLRKSEAPKSTGIDVKAAVQAFEGVLGTRLVMPMGSVWGIMQNRIRALGLTVEDCTKIATVAAGEWAGRVKAESLVRQAEKLLQGDKTSTPVRGKRGALDMEDL